MSGTHLFRGGLVSAGAVALVILLSATARAQTGGSGATTQPSDDAWRQQMESRMQALERENADLKAQVAKPGETQQAVLKDALAHTEGFHFNPRAGSVTPSDFDTRKYVAEGDFPGSVTIPGTNISIQIGGFVQLDAIADNHNIGSRNSFIVSSIPTQNEGAGQTTFSVKQTRLFVKTEGDTELGSLVTYFEGDFFTSDGTNLRIRHAYGEIGDKHKFLAGQTNSTFMDASVYPAIFDYQGPNGMVLVRQPMVRYTENFSDSLRWQIALESPNPDLSHATTVDGTGTAQWPDLTSNVRWSRDWGHLQLAGIVRELQFDPTVGSRSTDVGWGLNFSGSLNVLPPLAKNRQDNIVYQIAGGKGIANYFNDTSGLGLDGFTKSDGNLDALGMWGGFAAYQHYWSPKWASTVGYSYIHMNDVGGQAGSTFRSGHYAVANIMWYPAERVWVGLEFLYGVREDQNGNNGSDGRMSFSAQYRF